MSKAEDTCIIINGDLVSFKYELKSAVNKLLGLVIETRDEGLYTEIFAYYSLFLRARLSGSMFSTKKDVTAERQMQMFEIEMMQLVFSNMTNSCMIKCIPARYSDGDLTKGEAVCLDRCAAKFMEAYMHTTKKLSTMTMPEGMPTQT